MLPLQTTAATVVPSLDEVMEYQAFVLPGDAVFSVHVAPEFVEVQMFPPELQITTAASLVPSLDEVMELPVLLVSPRRCPQSTWRPSLAEVQMLPY